MIQRIQTLYLLATAILMGILCFAPFVSFLWEGEIFRQNVWGAWSTAGEMAFGTIPMGILTLLSALLPVVTIFLYKRRGLQMRLCVVELILLLGVVIYLGMYLFRSSSEITDKVAFSIVDLFPVLGMILTLMASKRILKDQLLIKSLDRIR
ncbi:MAG: DUF4293 domain-containing protein [Rikenellaceae bacterium]|nr:DUF4293 domain-containing protein [Rikenellaceae bacterium]